MAQCTLKPIFGEIVLLQFLLLMCGRTMVFKRFNKGYAVGEKLIEIKQAYFVFLKYYVEVNAY